MVFFIGVSYMFLKLVLLFQICLMNRKVGPAFEGKFPKYAISCLRIWGVVKANNYLDKKPPGHYYL